MIVVDTSALVAVINSEPETPALVQVLVELPSCVAAPTLFEFLMVTEHDRFASGRAIAEHIFVRFNIEVLSWTAAHAAIAQSAFLRFGRGHHPAKLNFGDCMSYALAKSLDAPLLYKGEDFALTDVRSAVAR